MADEDLTKPTEIEFCTGSFSAVRTAEFKAVGGFDEHYFMYVEDADLTQKMRTTGKAYLVPAVHGHPCLAPGGPPQPETVPLAGRQPAAVFLASGASNFKPLLVKEKNGISQKFLHSWRFFLAFLLDLIVE